MAATEGKPTLQHLNNSQSQTILWLLEELEIPYNLNLFEREKGRAPESLKATHPLGKSPQLITASGRVIVERSAITAYLIETYDSSGRFKISNRDEDHDAIREQELVGYAEASFNVMSTLAMMFYYLKTLTPFFIRPFVTVVSAVINIGMLNGELDAQFKYMDSLLAGQEFFMSDGNPTRVDFIMLFFVQTLHESKVKDIAPYTNVKAWVDRCVARPAWKRALEKGNGYSLV